MGYLKLKKFVKAESTDSMEDYFKSPYEQVLDLIRRTEAQEALKADAIKADNGAIKSETSAKEPS